MSLVFNHTLLLKPINKTFDPISWSYLLSVLRKKTTTAYSKASTLLKSLPGTEEFKTTLRGVRARMSKKVFIDRSLARSYSKIM